MGSRLRPDVAFSVHLAHLRTYDRLTNRERVRPFEEVKLDRASVVRSRRGTLHGLHTIASARPSGDKENE